jgi:hypothetical protein
MDGCIMNPLEKKGFAPTEGPIILKPVSSEVPLNNVRETLHR